MQKNDRERKRFTHYKDRRILLVQQNRPFFLMRGTSSVDRTVVDGMLNTRSARLKLVSVGLEWNV